jgi:hypothetical protein
MSVESLPRRRNRRDADEILAKVINLNTRTTAEWVAMRDARAERSAWDDLEALASGYGYDIALHRRSGRYHAELSACGRRYHAVSSPSRAAAVELLVAWLERENA